MADPLPNRERLDRLPAHAWVVMAVVCLAVVYIAIQATQVRPYLWPAGSGMRVTGDPASRIPLLFRPPALDPQPPGTVVAVAPRSPAAAERVRPGDVIRSLERPGGHDRVESTVAGGADAAARLEIWRRSYWLGVSGPVTAEVVRADGTVSQVPLPRPAVWRSNVDGWARLHVGMVLQMTVFVAGGIVLLFLRSHDLTAGLSVLALTLSGVAAAGPLVGAESAWPLGRMLTVFGWLAMPAAFPLIALAILYFPTKSPLLVRHRWLHAVPVAVAMPMIAPSVMTALYLAGLDAARAGAVWDTLHPAAYYGSFAAALALNIAAVGEGVYRYRFNHDANERRRIRMAIYTTVPGVLAYAVKDGAPILFGLTGRTPPQYPLPLFVVLQGLVLLPTFGLVYAIGVARVLGPRVVLRRSLQYAFASRTLTILGALPLIGLAASLVRDRNRTLGEIAARGSGVYLLLILLLVAAYRYRERARQWLDQRFFREEYDARKILLSLASRVRFETDPADLAAMVVGQIDAALHPEMIAILVSGVEDGQLTPVTVLHGSAESLRADAGIASMLTWSEEPLEMFLHDPRSPARRLPADEQEWLSCTGASLLVPVLARDRSLLAAIVLGARRSEEAYTAEDRQLLASIAAQMGLGFDVARLRRRTEMRQPELDETTRMLSAALRPMRECPKCGRCEEAGTPTCPADGTAMVDVPSVPRTVDNKYRLEQLLGRGGMGAVYRARDMRLDRLIALKVVRAELLGDVEARQRFRREAQIIARLQHPAIVAVYDYGTFADGGAYLVMELVRGEDLRRVLQREGRLDPPQAARILHSVCGGIEAAHRQGVLHRDLKPENILLPGSSTDAKVLDFGVAKVIEEQRDAGVPSSNASTLVTAAGMIVGTPAYMAPEQFHGTPCDARTDVFSLGVIAYEMMTGDLPFGRGSLADVVLTQSRGIPPMRPGVVPAGVERAVRTALNADPDRRPGSAQAFAHLVQSAIAT
jgi:eukaryotic-like serine/threonine-protein kinase